MDDSTTYNDRSLNILRIARAVYPESMGGGAIHVHSMSKRQSEMGHNVIVLTSDRGDRSLSPAERRDGYALKRHRELGTLFGNSLTPGIIRSLRAYNDEIDIIHIHSHLSFLSNIVALRSYIDDTPLIVTNHGLRSQTAPDWIQNLYLPTLGKFTFNSADMVLTYSDTEREELRDLGITAPISVIHNGVDCTKFSPRKTDTEGQQLLFVGRLRESKGPKMVLKIFEQLADDFPDLTVKIVGDGPLRTELEQYVIAHGLEDRVSVLGEVENEAMPQLYNESSVFVLPTEREGVPRTVLEAMASGTPVVTTNLPQVEPVVDEGGIVVDRSIEGFSGAIRSLLMKPDRRKEMGDRGRNRVLENYSWEETVKETTEQYYTLLE